jgi:hypothetical protein
MGRRIVLLWPDRHPFEEHVLRNRLFWILGSLASLACAAPAYAAEGLMLPEPGSVTLVSLALAGVIVGRRMSNKRPPKD